MAQIGTTEAAVMLADVWSAKMAIARIENFVAANKVDRYDDDTAKYGDVLHIPNISAATVSAVGVDGSFTISAPTETETQINMNNEYAYGFRITDRVMDQSKYNLPPKYQEQGGAALARQIETDIFGLYSGFSQVITQQADFDEDFLLQGVQKLDEAKAPEDNRFLFVRPSQKRAVLKIDKFVSDQFRGGAGSQITKGRLTMDIGGVEVNVSVNVVRTGGVSYNVMWHKSAIALAVQRQVKFEEFARDGFRRTWAASELYGFGEVRDNHGVQLPTDN